MTLKKFGAQVEFGKGVATAQKILLEAYCGKPPVIFGNDYLELTNESSCI